MKREKIIRMDRGGIVFWVSFVILSSGCCGAVMDTPTLMNEFDECYDLAEGNKTVYNICRERVLDNLYGEKR